LPKELMGNVARVIEAGSYYLFKIMKGRMPEWKARLSLPSSLTSVSHRHLGTPAMAPK